jgi:hypothetical protein
MTRRPRPRTTFRGVLNNERGVALAFVAVLLVVLLGMAALAVDLGLLFNARTEVQRVADSAALAGAAGLIDSPGNEALARQLATDYAMRNDVRAMGIELLPEDIDVELWRDRVRVRAYRTTARGTGLANLFARILGQRESSVSAVAAAEAAIAGGAECILPFALVDRWWETAEGRLANRNDFFTRTSDIYNPGPLEALPGSPEENTGFGRPDRGTVFRIYPGSTGDSPQPGWYYPIALSPGASVYRDAIAGCTDDVRSVVMINEPIDIEPGRMVGPTRQGFDDLLATDPNAYWDDDGGEPGSGGCVKRRNGGNECVVGSPRERPMVLLDPREQPTSPGRQAVTIRNFVGVFFICQGVISADNQSCTGGGGGNNPDAGVWVRFVDYRGVNPMSSGDATQGSLLRVLRLVE